MNGLEYIRFTKSVLPFGWMGNMSPYPIVYNKKEWKSAEALFQSLRFNDETIKEMIRAEKNPMNAKLKAKEFIDKMSIVQLSNDDVDNMKFCIKLKIEQYPNLKKLLLNTNDIPIYEDVTKRGDKGSNLFWGAMLVDNKWIGQNVLGNIWMDFRKEYKDL